jgi:hypothetical protein
MIPRSSFRHADDRRRAIRARFRERRFIVSDALPAASSCAGASVPLLIEAGGRQQDRERESPADVLGTVSSGCMLRGLMR